MMSGKTIWETEAALNMLIGYPCYTTCGLVGGYTLYMMSAKFWDLFTPSPLSAFVNCKNSKINANSFTLFALPRTPSPLECGRHLWKLPFFKCLNSQSKSSQSQCFHRLSRRGFSPSSFGDHMRWASEI